jgi:hypothetical protein
MKGGSSEMFSAVQLLYKTQNDAIFRELWSSRRATRLLHPARNSPPSKVKNSPRFGCVLYFRLGSSWCPPDPFLSPVSPYSAVQLLYRFQAVPDAIRTQRLSIYQRPAARSRARNARLSGTSSRLFYKLPESSSQLLRAPRCRCVSSHGILRHGVFRASLSCTPLLERPVMSPSNQKRARPLFVPPSRPRPSDGARSSVPLVP